ncbi:Calcineurin-like phosphoesterase [Carpediemonas membranifera]|uniref:Serine/threonine-protein phosphatase n=1 Tax=Carpediemonas membranifera TaxID=201153 RepID=A0A8J6ASA8_9EUKA|nr:Calcineurin-like phosphoesterase [Carpediemonas membranifera]|eukprot:KAG9393181.1 Calcineurin-like phosphoesterase [Carpediemonas membranifera]
MQISPAAKSKSRSPGQSTNVTNIQRRTFVMPWPPHENYFHELVTNLKESQGTLIPDVHQFLQLIEAAAEILKQRETVVNINVQGDEAITVVGDVHGHFFDVCQIFEIVQSYPSDKHKFLFNGDIVDRGSFSTEILYTLLYMLVARPDSMFINRGNHESDYCTNDYGFRKEVLDKYGAPVANGPDPYAACLKMFRTLPIASVVLDTIFVVHGGLWEDLSITVDDLRRMDRDFEFSQSPDVVPTAMMQALWADPHDGRGLAPTFRPFVRKWGSDRTAEFLDTNNLDFLIRSHEVVNEGYIAKHGETMCTLFSAPNYMNSKNKGAVLTIRPKDAASGKIRMNVQSFLAAVSPERYSYAPEGCVAM